jgi:hypothetical protein
MIEEKELLLKEAHLLAEAFTKKMVPKTLRELETYFEKDGSTYSRESFEPVIGKWLAMTYALGYMDAVERKQIKKLYV